MIDGATLISAGAITVSALVGLANIRQSRSTSKRRADTDASRVEAEAYDWAKGINRGMVEDIQRDYAALMVKYRELQQHTEKQDQAIAKLERRAARLERFIVAAGLELPPHLAEQ